MSLEDRDAPSHESTRARAAALAYDPLAQQAPSVIAKGSGVLAERIIALAHERGLPVHKDPELLQFLMRVDLDETIPPALYLAVASVLALVWSADRDARQTQPLRSSALPPDDPNRG